MKKISVYLEMEYVEKGGKVVMESVERDNMPKDVHFLGIRMGRCKFSISETVEHAFVAEGKATATKNASTKVKNSQKKADAEKCLKSAEKNFNLAEEAAREAREAALREAEGATPEVIASLNYAVMAAENAYEKARKALEEAQADFAARFPDDVLQGDTPQGDVPQDDIPQGDVPQGDTPQGDASQGDDTQDTDPVADKATAIGLTESDPIIVVRGFEDADGKKWAYLPKANTFICLTHCGKVGGTPQDFVKEVLKVHPEARVPFKAELAEAEALELPIDFTDQLCVADDKFTTCRGEVKRIQQDYYWYRLKCIAAISL